MDQWRGVLRYLALIVTAIACSLPTVSQAQVAAERPNIIIILADDLGFRDVGFTGATEIFTPTIDALASGGVIFDNGYVTHPYCGPSRAGIMTGRYQARFGVEGNFPFAPEDPHAGLPVSEITIADRLREVGYRTGFVGKWHLGVAPHFQPNARGFDHFFGFLDGGHQYMPGEIAPHRGGYWEPLWRNNQPATLDEYLTTALSRDGVQFIKEDSDRPFFLYMSYNAPHTPLQAPQAYIEQYTHIEDQDRRVYAAMIAAMDDGIAMLVDALKESGQYENTLIFFLSDNGGVFPEAWQPTFDWSDNAPFRRGKVALTEGGIRVPFFASWPSRFPAGTRFDGLVSALDIAATSVAVAGAQDAEGLLEGVDLVPFATGRRSDSPHEALFWRLEEADNIWAVRTLDYKYLNQTLPGVGQSFFDMRTDPYESTNLYPHRAKEQARLAALWNRWNSDNVNNVLQQAADYENTMRTFRDEHYRQRLEQAKDRAPYTIE